MELSASTSLITTVVSVYLLFSGYRFATGRTVTRP